MVHTVLIALIYIIVFAILFFIVVYVFELIISPKVIPPKIKTLLWVLVALAALVWFLDKTGILNM
jgi:hypothetical protein